MVGFATRTWFPPRAPKTRSLDQYLVERGRVDVHVVMMCESLNMPEFRVHSALLEIDRVPRIVDDFVTRFCLTENEVRRRFRPQ